MIKIDFDVDLDADIDLSVDASHESHNCRWADCDVFCAENSWSDLSVENCDNFANIFSMIQNTYHTPPGLTITPISPDHRSQSASIMILIIFTSVQATHYSPSLL